MLDLKQTIDIGDTIRHLKRGTRYRVLRSFTAEASKLTDGERSWLTDAECSGKGGSGCALSKRDMDPYRDAVSFAVPVIVQISDATKRAAKAPISMFLYIGLDAPGHYFVRPADEFTADRFERLGVRDPLAWLVQSLLPEEQFQILSEWRAIQAGQPAPGTRLIELAAGFSARAAPGGSCAVEEMMQRIAERTRTELGGEYIRMPLTLSAEETAAVQELSALQELSPERIIRQALRLYQSEVKGVPDLPKSGCMGD